VKYLNRDVYISDIINKETPDGHTALHLAILGELAVDKVIDKFSELAEFTVGEDKPFVKYTLVSKVAKLLLIINVGVYKIILNPPQLCINFVNFVNFVTSDESPFIILFLWKTWVLPVEIGCRGFPTCSLWSMFRPMARPERQSSEE
jgi:hypothetical protein